MGAEHVLDLTANVTHLVAGALDTPKYNYVAKERPDVRVVQPAWVEAVRQSWMAGGETRVAELERAHRLPALHGLRVCITGFEDLATRKAIEESVNANGARYCGDLNKEVTHLIAKGTAGLKYQYARTWGVRVVAIEWLEQSLERGMVLEERLFDPTIAQHERGVGAVARRDPSVQSKKRKGDALVRTDSGRKLRRTASAKFDSQNDGMWTGIVGQESHAEPARHSEWDDGSVVEIHLDCELQADSSRPPTAQATSDNLSSMLRPKSSRGMFEGRRFHLHGFDAKQTSILTNHLRSHNAEIVTEMAQLTQSSSAQGSARSYVVIPHRIQASDIPATLDLSSQLVNELWIEKCLDKKQYVDPTANVLHKPFPFPIADFRGMTISSTAFEGIELRHVSKAVELLGATYDGALTRHISVLVCNTTNPNREKIKHAVRWNVPAVNAQWLWDCIRHSEKRSFDEYLLYPDVQAPPSDDTKPEEDTGPDGRSQSGGTGDKSNTRSAHDSSKSSRAGSRTEAVGPFKEDSAPNSPSAAEELEPTASQDSILKVSQSSRNTRDSKPPASMSFSKPPPLRERSPNISPKPSPPKPSAAPSAASEPSIPLKDAISSLLVHHKTHRSGSLSAASSGARPGSRGTSHGPASAAAAASDDFGGPGPARRKRKLLGRALSNLSAHSAERSVQVSPAKSLASANTDGLGTPIELPPELERRPTTASERALEPAAKQGPVTRAEKALSPGLLSDERDPEAEATRAPALTQVGYEDEEARWARLDLVRKMNGRIEEEEGEDEAVEVGMAEKKARIMKEDDGGVGGIARRTRGAAARF